MKKSIYFLLFSFLINFVAYNLLANTLYVDVNSMNPLSPYSNWFNAAANIQDAVDVASPGSVIWVETGIYNNKGTNALGQSILNRVMVDKDISLYGIGAPIIEGFADSSSSGLGSNAVRCVYLNKGAKMSGFVLRGGYTYKSENDPKRKNNGNNYNIFGGGAFINDGEMYNCFVVSNRASVGGGIHVVTGTVGNCTIIQNSATDDGGGVHINGPGSFRNCIIRDNDVNNISIQSSGGLGDDILKYSNVEYTLSSGLRANGNINEKAKLNTNGILSPDSPCINRGNNLLRPPNLMYDLWGNLRIIGEYIDIGSYESTNSFINDFLISLSNDYKTVQLTWSNACATILMCTNRYYSLETNDWFIATNSISPWFDTDASNWPSIYYRIVKGYSTSSYDVGKYDVELEGADEINDKFYWLGCPFNLFYNSFKGIFKNILTSATSPNQDSIKQQVTIGSTNVSESIYDANGNFTGDNTNWYKGKGYLLKRNKSHTNDITLTFVGWVSTNDSVISGVQKSDGLNDQVNWLAYPFPVKTHWNNTGLTNSVVTTNGFGSWDLVKQQVSPGKSGRNESAFTSSGWTATDPKDTNAQAGVMFLLKINKAHSTPAKTKWIVPKPY